MLHFLQLWKMLLCLPTTAGESPVWGQGDTETPSPAALCRRPPGPQAAGSPQPSKHICGLLCPENPITLLRCLCPGGGRAEGDATTTVSPATCCIGRWDCRTTRGDPPARGPLLAFWGPLIPCTDPLVSDLPGWYQQSSPRVPTAICTGRFQPLHIGTNHHHHATGLVPFPSLPFPGSEPAPRPAAELNICTRRHQPPWVGGGGRGSSSPVAGTTLHPWEFTPSPSLCPKVSVGRHKGRCALHPGGFAPTHM